MNPLITIFDHGRNKRDKKTINQKNFNKIP